MNRTSLQQEAFQAAKHARHNLKLIQQAPNRINNCKHADAVSYLQMMIRFADRELAATRLPRKRLLDRLRGVMLLKIKSS